MKKTDLRTFKGYKIALEERADQSYRYKVYRPINGKLFTALTSSTGFSRSSAIIKAEQWINRNVLMEKIRLLLVIADIEVEEKTRRNT